MKKTQRLCLIEMAILVFCISSMTNGKYSVIKQNTIYDILMLFDAKSQTNIENDGRYYKIFQK